MKKILRWLLTLGMVTVGITHFTSPEGFVAIVPDYLPYPLALVYVSGFFEILGGAGLCFRKFRRFSAWGLVLLYLAVFPANINMAIHHLPLNGNAVPIWALWARLPMQAVLMVWAGWYTRPEGNRFG